MSPAALLLSDQSLLNQYLQGNWPTPDSNWHRVFQATREQQPFQPDYATESRLIENGLIKVSATSTGYAQQLLCALDHLAKPLWLRGEAIYVQANSFELWQQRLTLVMPLPLISFFALRHFQDERRAEASFGAWFKNGSCLPSPYLPELEALARQGLTEHHLHIMGTTESDTVWQHALNKPKHMLADLTKAQSKSVARQQLQQVNPSLAFSDLYRLLRLASSVRRELLKLVQGCSNFSLMGLRELCTNWPVEFSSKHPASQYTRTDNRLVSEATLLYASYQHLAKTASEVTARCLHIYLLTQSLFHRLLSQQLLDKGFQQFEKITQNEVRESAERWFSQRFQQVQGMYNRPLGLLEARFAPKNSTLKLRELLQSISSGYKKSDLYKTTPLSLTAHFIKQKDKPKELHPCRHYPLRTLLDKQQKILCNYLNLNPDAREKVISIDAAGNELNAGPEVFAPLYGQLRKQGFKFFTYHAGEDFRHLLSGMRQIYEAVHFLELMPGDRIGHATAIGIEPDLWLRRSAPAVQVEKGEWLDTLLFTHCLLLQLEDAQANSQAYMLEQTILELAECLFDTGGLSVQSLKTAWLNRGHNPLQLQANSLISEQTKTLLLAWHRPETYRRSRQFQSVSSDTLPADLYRRLQNKLITLLNEKQIAIESLPTSNLRISYYKKYSEHHIHRWLDPNEAARPTVVLGSDDPGIFATSIYNEYAHVVLSENRLNGNRCGVASELMENGRRFGFWCDGPKKSISYNS